MSATTPREGDTLPAVAGQTQAGWQPYDHLDSPEADPFAALGAVVAAEDAARLKRRAAHDRAFAGDDAHRITHRRNEP